MMPESVRLSDVFLSPNFGLTEPHCMIYANGALDELEYGLGVERGWLLSSLSKESDHFNIIWEEMNEDVCREIRRGRIGLLPDSDVISKMLTLRHHNYYCPLRERRPFYEELPFTDYTYTLLPAVFPSPKALYIKDNDAFPSPLPLTEPVVRIKSRLHPLILLENAAFYALMLQSRPHLQHIIDQDTSELLISANIPSFGRVQESWLNLGDVEGNRKYSKRHAVYYMPDIVRTEKAKRVKKRVKVKKNEGEAGQSVARKRVKKTEKVPVDSESEPKPLHEVN